MTKILNPQALNSPPAESLSGQNNQKSKFPRVENPMGQTYKITCETSFFGWKFKLILDFLMIYFSFVDCVNCTILKNVSTAGSSELKNVLK